MTDPANGGHDSLLFTFSPKELIMYMEELLHRLSRVGDRLDSYTKPKEMPVPVIEALKESPNLTDINP